MDGEQNSRCNISDEVFVEIGKVIVLHNLIEESVSEIVIAILEAGGLPRSLGMILTCELSFKQRIGVLESLLIEIVPRATDIRSRFKVIRPRLFKAEEVRNQIAHSLWGAPIGNDSLAAIRIKHTAKAGKGLISVFLPLTLNELQKYTTSMEETYRITSLFELGFRKDADEGAPSN